MNGVETPVIEQQFKEMRDRMTALEADNAGLRAREERTVTETALAGMRFSEGRKILAPASRMALADAVLAIADSAQRKTVLDAIGGVQFADLTERGFVPDESGAGDALTAAEEQRLQETAKRNGLKFGEVKASFLEVRKRREQGGQ